jgi:hypothetical protein
LDLKKFVGLIWSLVHQVSKLHLDILGVEPDNVQAPCADSPRGTDGPSLQPQWLQSNLKSPGPKVSFTTLATDRFENAPELIASKWKLTSVHISIRQLNIGNKFNALH